MVTKKLDIASATVRTTDATVTPITTYTIPDESVAQIYVHVIGQQTSTNCAGFIRRFVVKQQSGGGAVLVGTVDSTIFPDKEDVSTWDVTVTLATDVVTINVTGVDAVTIDWFVWAQIVLYTP